MSETITGINALVLKLAHAAKKEKYERAKRLKNDLTTMGVSFVINADHSITWQKDKISSTVHIPKPVIARPPSAVAKIKLAGS